jgi:hypothetical protein
MILHLAPQAKNIADDRISYVLNPKRLGAAGNINQCFPQQNS